VLDTTLARRIARAHGFQRTGSRIQERIKSLALSRYASSEEAVGTFYWPPGVLPDTVISFRWPADDGQARHLDEICEQELRSLAQHVLAQDKSGEDAITTMARQIGLSRLTAGSRGRLQQVLQGLTGQAP